MKPTCFGLLDFTAGYHQTPIPVDTGCHGTERSWPLLSTTKVFHGLVYIDDVLTHGKTGPEFLSNT